MTLLEAVRWREDIDGVLNRARALHRRKLVELQEQCPHDWVLSQVAGDGYTCRVCSAWKPEED